MSYVFSNSFPLISLFQILVEPLKVTVYACSASWRLSVLAVKTFSAGNKSPKIVSKEVLLAASHVSVIRG